MINGRFEKGDVVQVSDLTNACHLNGIIGAVIGYREKDDRYLVQIHHAYDHPVTGLPTRQTLALRRINLFRYDLNDRYVPKSVLEKKKVAKNASSDASRILDRRYRTCSCPRCSAGATNMGGDSVNNNKPFIKENNERCWELIKRGSLYAEKGDYTKATNDYMELIQELTRMKNN